MSGGRPRQAPPPCGTYQAYQRHRRDGQEQDRACLDAAADYAQQQRRARARLREPSPPVMPERLSLGMVHLRDVPSEQLRAAALAVCDRATDAGDARRLLDMVGLLGVLRGGEAA